MSALSDLDRSALSSLSAPSGDCGAAADTARKFLTGKVNMTPAVAAALALSDAHDNGDCLCAR